MNPRLASLLLLALPAHAALPGFIDDSDEPTTEAEDVPAMELLLQGSILTKVLIPQYDDELRLASVFRAGKLTLIDKSTIDAEQVRIEFYNADESPKAAIDLQQARLEKQRILRTGDPVTLVSERFFATGSGLIYEIDKSRGILLGPATATFNLDRKTTMNTPLRSALAGAALMASAASQSEGIRKLTEAETAELDRLATSNRPAIEAARADTAAMVDLVRDKSAVADLTLGKFLKKASLTALAAQLPNLSEPVPAPEMPEFDNPISFDAVDGIYFDSTAGLVVLLKEVSIDHPEFTLKGADEVKVFLEKKEPAPSAEAAPEDPEPDAKKSDGVFGDADFGDPSRIAATGAVVVETKPTEDKPDTIKASGRQMVLDLETNELVIRGGRPWVISPDGYFRMKDDSGSIRINIETKDVSVDGESSFDGELPKND